MVGSGGVEECLDGLIDHLEDILTMDSNRSSQAAPDVRYRTATCLPSPALVGCRNRFGLSAGRRAKPRWGLLCAYPADASRVKSTEAWRHGVVPKRRKLLIHLVTGCIQRGFWYMVV
jgi:hypothetical protein